MDVDNTEDMTLSAPTLQKDRCIEVESGRSSSQTQSQQFESFQNLGCVYVSGLRVPLVMRDSYSLRSRSMFVNGAVFDDSDNGSGIFCVVRIGDKICQTSTSRTALHLVTDVTFDEVFRFDKVKPSFKCTIEVYYLRLQSSTLQRASRKLRSSVSVPRYRDELGTPRQFSFNHEDLINKSDCLGRVTLGIDDVDDMVRSHCLTSSSSESNRSSGHRFLTMDSKCPTLFGQICVRLVAVPYLHSTNIRQEILHATISDRLPPTPMNVQLSGSYLSATAVPSPPSSNGDASSTADMKKDTGSDDVTELMRLPVNKSLSMTSYSGEITVLTEDSAEQAAPLQYCVAVQDRRAATPSIILCLESRQSQLDWSRDLQRAVEYSQTWGRAGETPMTSPAPRSMSTWPSTCRKCSLYDEVVFPENQLPTIPDRYSTISFSPSRNTMLKYKVRSTLPRWGTIRASRMKL